MAEDKVKKNRLVEAFTKDYKYEGLILLVLAIIALVLGILMLIGESSEGASGLKVQEGVFLISDYPLVFAWLLVGLGAFSLLLTIWPYYKPSIYEVKRVSWPSKKQMLSDTICTFVFSAILVIFFLIIDSLLLQFINIFTE